MNTIDHGMWNAYTPTTLPEGAPPHAMFVRRDSDGVDWYDYVGSGTNSGLRQDRGAIPRRYQSIRRRPRHL